MRTTTSRSGGFLAGTLVEITQPHFLIVAALRAGEVTGASGGVGGDDCGLVVVVDVAALFTLVAIGDHRAPFSHDDPACNLYSQHATSERASIVPANRILSETRR